jgi:hypothetical protein
MLVVTLFDLFVTIIAGALMADVRAGVGTTVQHFTTFTLTSELFPTPEQ